MMTHQATEEALRQSQHRAHNIFTEVLTSVSPEVKEAMVALYHLVQADQELLLCRSQSHQA